MGLRLCGFVLFVAVRILHSVCFGGFGSYLDFDSFLSMFEFCFSFVLWDCIKFWIVCLVAAFSAAKGVR